jgi:tetratricopeptide (TPR) repeat protein
MSTGDPFQLAIEHQRAGRLGEAEAACRAILGRNANDLRAAHMLGVILLQQRRPADAAPLLQRAAAATNNADVQFVYGEACRLSGNSRPRRLRTQVPLDPRARPRRRTTRSGWRSCSRASSSRRSSRGNAPSSSSPISPKRTRNLGAALAQQKKYSEAAAVLRKAVQLNPRFAPAHNNLANVLNELEEIDAAMIEWQAAIDLSPNYFDA